MYFYLMWYRNPPPRRQDTVHTLRQKEKRTPLSPAAVDKPAPVCTTTIGAALNSWASFFASTRILSCEISTSASPHRPL